MGAFGELLQKHLGGTIHDVSTWGQGKESKKKGGTKKISDLKDIKICKDPEHNPPMHMVYKDGVYEHECPSCGKKQIFTVQNPSL